MVRIAAGSRDHINAMDMVDGYGDLYLIHISTSSHNRNENQGKGKRGKFYGYSFDSLLNASAVPQDEKVQAFIAESKNNRNRCYESVSYTHLSDCVSFRTWD